MKLHLSFKYSIQDAMTQGNMMRRHPCVVKVDLLLCLDSSVLIVFMKDIDCCQVVDGTYQLLSRGVCAK